MKKRFTSLLLGIACAASCVIGLCACAPKTGLLYKEVGDGYYVTSYYYATGLVSSAGDDHEALELEIPAEYNGKPVTGIADNAFDDMRELVSVVIPDSVTYIGKSAFRGDKYLLSVDFGKGVTEIGEYAFSGCMGLLGANLPESVTTLGKYAFDNCESLMTLNIPSKVTVIPEHFVNGKSITSFTIPEGVTTIKSFGLVFGHLQTITIPVSVTSLASRAIVINQLNQNKKYYVDYLGTKEQWEAIEKSEYWCEEHCQGVRCSDGNGGYEVIPYKEN